MNKNIRIVVILVSGLFLIAAFYLSARLKGQTELDSGYQPVMGTFARIVAIAADSDTTQECIRGAFAEINNIDELMSIYRSDSEISEVNRDGFSHAVKVSESTYEVLQRSVEFSKLTDGAFDITVGPLEELWRLAGEANSVPSAEQLATAAAKVGYEKLILDANEKTIRFAVEGMELDLGGIAKGYAIDKAVEAMQKCGAMGGMVDIGGDIRCFGKPPKGKSKWVIGLQDPGKINDSIVVPAEAGIQTGEYLLILQLTNEAVTTSGDYRRFVLIDGKRYSHIIDRRAAAGAQALASVTIIAGNATDADALATAVSVMGAEKGLALIEQTLDTEAILITPPPEYKLLKTTGAEKYIKK